MRGTTVNTSVGSDRKRRIDNIVSDRIPDTRMHTPVTSAFATVAILLPMIVGSLTAQTAPAALTFEVASIRPSDAKAQGMRFDLTPDDGLRATGVTVRFLLQKAYDVEDFQIVGGPGWARSERFDVYAKPGDQDGPDTHASSVRSELFRSERFRERLIGLLVDRFQLSVRQQYKEGVVYILEQTAKGNQLNSKTGTPGIKRNRGLITAESASVAMLAKTLSVTLQRPVLDETRLKDEYGFKLQWAEEGAPGEPEDSGVSLFTAIQEQLGLRLKSARGPIQLIFVDRVEKPSAN